MRSFGEQVVGGHLEAIAGPMFCGKSSELIRRLRRAQIAKQHLQVFKPAIDTRYAASSVASHARELFPAVAVPHDRPERIIELLEIPVRVVGIDEAQFMAPGVVEVCERLVRGGVRVIVAGLNQTSTGEPFGAMPALLAAADEVTILSAICMTCGGPATKTMKLVATGSTVEVGETDKYEARCRAHFTPTR